MTLNDSLIPILTIIAPHGVRGLVKFACHMDDVAEIKKLGPLRDEKLGRDFSLTLKGQLGKGQLGDFFLGQLSGITTREDAAKLKGHTLSAPRDKLPALPQGQYYHADLVGLTVQNKDGKILGTVKAVHDFGAGALLDVDRLDINQLDVSPAKGGMLVPFRSPFLISTNLQAKIICVDLPDDWLNF